MIEKKRVAVLGAGSWGTALAHHLRLADHEVRIWGREKDVLEAIREQAQNPKYFPGEVLSPNIRTCEAVAAAIAGVDAIVISVPAAGVRELAQEVAALITGLPLVVSTAKGLEDGSLKTMSAVLEEELGSKARIAVLSGPSFALEVLRGLPTAATIAAHDKATRDAAAQLFHHANFRIYTLADVIGVEFGGVFKNVIAIAAGIVDEAQMGANARAALITRGLAEMQGLVLALGGEAETVSGLSGLGDLLLTATGDLSRNRQVGRGLGRGEKLEDILKRLGQVAEGVTATEMVLKLARQNGVNVPITEQVSKILAGTSSVNESVQALFARTRRSEKRQ